MRLPDFILRNERLSKHSTLRIGGDARYFAEPSTTEECALARRFADDSRIPCITIGSGSNLLFDDKGFDGLVIKIGSRLGAISITPGHRIIAEAGAWLPAVARAAQSAGLAGIEHTAGIPGSVGGAIAMNAGSKRHSISESIRSVLAMDPAGWLHSLSPSACTFSYRRSAFLGSLRGWTVLEASFDLASDHPAAVRGRMLAVLRERSGKFPRKLPNCGSVFKGNPVIHATHGPPGKIVERLGFKGRRLGTVWVSDLHANFIVNDGSARSADFLELMRTIQAAAQERLGIALEPEVEYVAPRP